MMHSSDQKQRCGVTFDDVLVEPTKPPKLEVHIDTGRSNACKTSTPQAESLTQTNDPRGLQPLRRLAFSRLAFSDLAF